MQVWRVFLQFFIKTSQLFFCWKLFDFSFHQKFFWKLRLIEIGPGNAERGHWFFRLHILVKKSMLPKANKQRKKILNHITLNTLIPHIYFDFLGKGLLTQAVLASEKRDSMHLSVPTLHRNKVKDSSKLYIASSLNIDLILWHTQLIVCAVKCSIMV